MSTEPLPGATAAGSAPISGHDGAAGPAPGPGASDPSGWSDDPARAQPPAAQASPSGALGADGLAAPVVRGRDGEAPDQPAAVPASPSASSLPSGGVAAEAVRQSLLEAALQDLLERRQSLERQITELERRRDQLEQETRRSFSGQSDAIARRVRGFQDYLVGALQELAVAAEQIDLVPQPVLLQPSPLDQPTSPVEAPPPPAAAGQFSQDEELIRRLLQRYGGQPDFYADPWKLRRTLEEEGASLLEDWFLSQGGRGAQPSSGSRNRNALITAAAIAILGELYGDRFQTLVLAGQPERLGEWRRGLQDCLGLSREDFGPTSGIVLFERSDALIERADRLEERGELPFIVVDAAERVVDIPLLQFPLWLAFAAGTDELLEDDNLY